LNLLYFSLLVAALIVLALYEIPAMVKRKHWRDLAVFSALSLMVFTVTLLLLMNVDVPSPLRLVEALADAIRSLWARP
jgi:hypothetical protein